jgi:adenine-specific DNA-methyltransferase
VVLADWELHAGNAFELVSELEERSVQLTVTSPPYNIGKRYERRVELDRYLTPFRAFLGALYIKTAEAGVVCWQVGNYVEDGAVVPLDCLFLPLFLEAGFVPRNRIVWHFRHGLHAKRRFSGRHETIFVFSKGEEYTFNLDPVRVPPRYPNKRHYKGPRKGELSGSPLGANPGDVWEADPDGWAQTEVEFALAGAFSGSCVWDIPNVKNNHPEKLEHPCQFPVELAQRCVLAFSDPGDLVFDPFTGVGSSAIAALMHERRFLGIELDSAFSQTARERIARLERGELAVRPLGTPVHTPPVTPHADRPG